MLLLILWKGKYAEGLYVIQSCLSKVKVKISVSQRNMALHYLTYFLKVIVYAHHLSLVKIQHWKIKVKYRNICCKVSHIHGISFMEILESFLTYVSRFYVNLMWLRTFRENQHNFIDWRLFYSLHKFEPLLRF